MRGLTHVEQILVGILGAKRFEKIIQRRVKDENAHILLTSETFVSHYPFKLNVTVHDFFYPSHDQPDKIDKDILLEDFSSSDVFFVSRTFCIYTSAEEFEIETGVFYSVGGLSLVPVLRFTRKSRPVKDLLRILQILGGAS